MSVRNICHLRLTACILSRHAWSTYGTNGADGSHAGGTDDGRTQTFDGRTSSNVGTQVMTARLMNSDSRRSLTHSLSPGSSPTVAVAVCSHTAECRQYTYVMSLRHFLLCVSVCVVVFHHVSFICCAFPKIFCVAVHVHVCRGAVACLLTISILAGSTSQIHSIKRSGLWAVLKAENKLLLFFFCSDLTPLMVLMTT